MVTKLIQSRKEVRDKILHAVDLIVNPVVQTLSPQGGNVLYEDSQGGLYVTNDGVTIAKEISSSDPTEDAVITLIKHAALKSNAVAGDGTTTVTLFSGSLIRDGLKMLENGVKPMELKRQLVEFGRKLKSHITPITIDNDDQLLNIARISSNSDDKIAADILKVIKTAGQDGMVFINPNSKPETEIEEDSGYVIEEGMFSPEFANLNAFTAAYENVHVLVTDKRIYYEQEAETILRTAVEAGIKNLVIVARDFIGKSINVFTANHNRGVINLLLVKHSGISDTSNVAGSDLATYLGGKLVTEKDGKLVNNMTADQFILAKKVHSNNLRTVLVTQNPFNPALQDLIESIKAEKEKQETDELEKRLAILTTGMVTIKVGGATGIEMRERMFRYEDAINATRSAMKHGYLVGGGLAVMNAYVEAEHPLEFQPMFRRFAESSIRQIAENCGEHADSVVSKCYGTTGYNAKTGQFEDLLEAGVIDPYKVTEMAIDNSISVALAILTSNYIIVNSREKEKDGE
jgi:chaperonin GroEL